MHSRHYGTTPPSIVVVHGGPGAAGEIAPVAEELAARGYGVLEPFQTQCTIDGQINELWQAIQNACLAPVTLIGWSWGAWLSCLMAEKHPDCMKNLILVGSGPFDARYAECIQQTRLSRLNDDELREFQSVMALFDAPKNTTRIMELFDKTDGYATEATPHPSVELDFSIHEAVWKEAAELRRSGELLHRVSAIRCPTLAIHGDYDPHPADGVVTPLKTRVAQFEFLLLEKCGHKPWRESHAMRAFFEAVESACSMPSDDCK